MEGAQKEPVKKDSVKVRLPSENNRTGQVVHRVRRFLGVVLLFCAVLGGMGGLVYGLYRIAVISKSIYAVVFYSALGGLVVFYLLSGIKKKLLVKVMARIASVLVRLLFILFCIACVLLYGAFVVRFPVAGAAVTPILLALIIISFFKLKIGNFLRKYLQYLRQKY